MERTAEACRTGNLEYVSTMDPGDLQRLIGRADEDGRSLLHAAASSGSVPLVMPCPRLPADPRITAPRKAAHGMCSGSSAVMKRTETSRHSQIKVIPCMSCLMAGGLPAGTRGGDYGQSTG